MHIQSRSSCGEFSVSKPKKLGVGSADDANYPLTMACYGCWQSLRGSQWKKCVGTYATADQVEQTRCCMQELAAEKAGPWGQGRL